MSPDEIMAFAAEVRDGRWPVKKAELQEFMRALLAPPDESPSAGDQPAAGAVDHIDPGTTPAPAPAPEPPYKAVGFGKWPPENPTSLGDVWAGETCPMLSHVGVTRTSTGKLHVGPEVVQTYTKREALDLASAIFWLANSLE